jgi:hypothetical protein
MKRAALQVGFWLGFSISFIANCVLTFEVAGGILVTRYHGSPQAPLPLIFLGPPSLLFGIAGLACAWRLGLSFKTSLPIRLSLANLSLLPALLLGTIIWGAL